MFRILASEGHEGLEESKLFWLFVIYVHFQFPKFPTYWDIELCEADALGMPVLRSKMAEATALGAALAAGLSVGFYHNKEQFWDNMKNIWKHMHRYASLCLSSIYHISSLFVEDAEFPLINVFKCCILPTDTKLFGKAILKTHQI